MLVSHERKSFIYFSSQTFSSVAFFSRFLLSTLPISPPDPPLVYLFNIEKHKKRWVERCAAVYASCYERTFQFLYAKVSADVNSGVSDAITKMLLFLKHSCATSLNHNISHPPHPCWTNIENFILMSLFLCNEEMMKAAEFLRKERKNGKSSYFLAVSDEICFSSSGKNECFLASDEGKLCEAHLTLFYYVELLIHFRHGYYVFNTFMIRHKSGWIRQPPPRSSKGKYLFAVVVFTLSAEEEKSSR